MSIKYPINSDTEDLTIEETDVDEQLPYKLIIYNDDHNTFDWVIKSLVSVLRISSANAEQLAMLIHYKGKVIAKSGEFDVLKVYKDALIERKLSVTIEQ